MRTKLIAVFSLLVIASMILGACATPTPEKVIVTQVVPGATQVVTQIVAGTPQVQVITATPPPPQPTAGPKEFKSKDPTTFVAISIAGGPETLDPARDYETSGVEIIQNMYDTLVFYNREKVSELVPMLATEIPTAANGGISADGLTYTFKIRTGVKFHNGDDLTPQDVAFTFQRGILQADSNSPQWLLTEPILGSTAYNDITDQLDPDGTLGLVDSREALAKVDPAKLKAACEKVTSAITADNSAGTVTFKLAQSWGPFLITLAGTWGAIQDQKWVAANGGWDGSCDTWQNFYALEPEELNKTKLGAGENGTGPYILDHWTPNEEIGLKANENYWLKEPLWDGGPTGAPKIKTVLLKYIGEFSTRFAAFQAGDADWIAAGSPENWPQLDTTVGQTCDEAGKCTPSADKPDNFAVRYVKLAQIARTDAFFNFQLNTAGGNNFMGSGKLDGNGIPPDFFSDIHVRKAFAYCFDWETYITDVLQGEAKQAPTVMLPGEAGYDESTPMYTYDPKKCEEEFKASTWKSADGKSLWDIGFRLTVAYNAGNQARQTVAQIFTNNISAVNPKFVVESTALPWAAYLNAYQNKKLPFFIIGWQEDIPDPHNWTFTYSLGAYGGKQKMPKELKDQLAPIVTTGVHETDFAKRSAIYKQFNQLFYDNIPTILLANALGRRYFQRWVSGFYNNPIYGNLYYYVLSKQ
jgi:peptide/nickel transport system substrate-binding protein